MAKLRAGHRGRLPFWDGLVLTSLQCMMLRLMKVSLPPQQLSNKMSWYLPMYLAVQIQERSSEKNMEFVVTEIRVLTPVL